jgi:nitroimidazol reductase NimA-like FMN-containing flavoprotein (pyridoxamine 5'-phosphate oxidase superfamily)/ribosomal protein S18 acetylase RimI-like enzyme
MPQPMTPGAARALLARAPFLHVAGLDADGQPLARPLHGALVGDHLVFHGGARGEKVELVGGPVVATACEVVARIPSWFLDPQRACPATTLYRSVEVRGVLEPLTDPAERARALDAFSGELQPERGFLPIDLENPLYRGSLDGLFIAALPLDGLVSREKLGAERPAAWRSKVAAGLWGRGDPGDVEALEALRTAAPDTPLPPVFSCRLEGFTLFGAADLRHLEAAVALLSPQYWNLGIAPEALAHAHRHSSAWVVATDPEGQLAATARAVGDGRKVAWIYDVAVRADLRGRGLGKALLALLLDHPAVRRCGRVLLGTQDAMALYAGFGFVPLHRPQSTVMVRTPT